VGVRLALAFVLALATASAALADSGEGPLPQQARVVNVPSAPIEQLGDDAFRFSVWRFKSLYWVVELRRADANYAEGEITFYNHANLRVGWLRFYLRLPDYDRLMAKIDAALARGDRRPLQASPNQIIVCADGPLYASERRKGGREWWIATSQCGYEDPNEDVRNLLQSQFQKDLMCVYALRADRRCPG
jgi:hypothetical protein